APDSTRSLLQVERTSAPAQHPPPSTAPTLEPPRSSALRPRASPPHSPSRARPPCPRFLQRSAHDRTAPCCHSHRAGAPSLALPSQPNAAPCVAASTPTECRSAPPPP